MCLQKEQEVKRQRRLLEQMEAATSTEIVPLVEDSRANTHYTHVHDLILMTPSVDGGDGHTPTTSPVFATQVDDNASSGACND